VNYKNTIVISGIVILLALSFLHKAVKAQQPPVLGPLLNISNNPGFTHSPFQRVDQTGNVHVVWEDETPGQRDIFYRRVNADETLGLTTNISNNLGESFLGPRSAIGVDPLGKAHIVWRDKTPHQNGNIFYGRFNSDGTLALTINLSESIDFTTGQVLTVDQFGNAHVVWHIRLANSEFETLYRKVNADGTVGPLLNLTNNPGPLDFPGSLSVVTDSNGNAYVIWADNSIGNFEIFYQKINNDGTLGSPLTNVSNNSGNSFGTFVRIDTLGNLHIAWSDNTLSNFETFYLRVNADGTLGNQTNVSNTSGDSDSPGMVEDDLGGAHIVWGDNSLGNIEILYRKIQSDGSLGFPLNLSQSGGESMFINDIELPAIARDSQGNIHVTWTESQQGDLDIMYRKVEGGFIPRPLRNLSNNPTVSEFPFLMVDSLGNTHVVWRNERTMNPEGNFDILYRVVKANGGLNPTFNLSEGLFSSNSYSITLRGISNINAVWRSLISNINPQPVDIFYRRSL